jgi:hypothetical protein
MPHGNSSHQLPDDWNAVEDEGFWDLLAPGIVFFGPLALALGLIVWWLL